MAGPTVFSRGVVWMGNCPELLIEAERSPPSSQGAIAPVPLSPRAVWEDCPKEGRSLRS
ncbi:hypothetical protein PN441_11970 [Spirulina major CS-329]|nr:hypothetical protein [Spirulina subsalsa CS-330]MDB9503790.1 hypothetical protein [Spirulina major CS-329]